MQMDGIARSDHTRSFERIGADRSERLTQARAAAAAAAAAAVPTLSLRRFSAVQPSSYYRLVVSSRPLDLALNSRLRALLQDNYRNIPVVVPDRVPVASVAE
jgi:hypothetical protein